MQLYKKDTFSKLVVDQSHLNSPDPVEAFLYMEIQMVQQILNLVNESVNSIIRVLKDNEMLTAKSQKEATELLKGVVPQTWD